MQTWWKAAVITVISMVGLGYAAGSVLGGPEELPDVGAPVVLEQAGNVPADDRVVDDDPGGIVYPDPEGDQQGALERRQERREARQERRELRQDRREARLERREERAERRDDREQRERSRTPPPVPTGDDGAADDGRAGDDNGGDDDGGDDDGGDDDGRDDDGDDDD